MIDRVQAMIEGHGLLRRGRRIGVAVSGGADSVFLLHALHELGLAAIVLHVNHQLRGTESDADQQFVRDLATKLGLPVAVTSAPPAAGNLEEEARLARYRFFASQIAAGACDSVATGHNLDDQAETVIYRLMRGSGTAGLSGIRVSTETGLIRPLLDLERAGIRQWLSDRKIDWREDSSNQDTGFVRNRLRTEIMPKLSELNPAFVSILARSAFFAADEETYWDREIGRLAPAHMDQSEPEIVIINTVGWREIPLAVRRRLLRTAILYVRSSLRSIDLRHIEAILALMATQEGSGRLQIPGLDVYRSFDLLRLAPIGYDNRVPRNFEVPLAIPGLTRVPDRSIALITEQVAVSDVYNSESGCADRDCFDPDRFSPDRVAVSFVLRNWQPGDRIEVFGRSGVEKIKTLFQDFRVPLWERRNWPVIEAGGAIVWCRRFGVAREFRVGPDSRRGVKIQEWKESSPAQTASTEVGLDRTGRSVKRLSELKR